MTIRVIAVLALFLSIFSMPFWFSALLAFAGIIYFNFFIEAVIIMFLVDLVYGIPESKFLDLTFVVFLSFLILFILTELLKKKVRWVK